MNLIFLHTCFLVALLDEIWTNPPNGEIDDFINKLMSSDKIDELAEKIAEKAARKIFDLDHIRISHNIQTNNEDPLYMLKHISLREKDRIENIEDVEDKTTETGMNQRATTQNNELNLKQNIDRDNSSKEQLRLKFKNLSKASRGNGNKYKVNNKNTKIESHDSKFDFEKNEQTEIRNGVKHHKSQFEKVNNQHKNRNKKDKSFMSTGNVKKSNEEINKEIGKHKNKGDGKKEESYEDKGSEEKDTSNLPIIRGKDTENDGESIESKLVKKTKDSNERNVSNNELLVEIVNDGKEKQTFNEGLLTNKNDREKYDTEKENHSNEEDVRSVKKRYSMTTRRLIIRREGNKLIAFENQPDYQEYEEIVTNKKVERK